MKRMRPELAILVEMVFSLRAFAEVDQEFVPPAVNGISNVGTSGGLERAQTFTVETTGTLTGFDVLVNRPDNATLPLRYDIRTTVAGAPTEPDDGPNILVSGAVEPSQIVFPGTTIPGPLGSLLHVELGSDSFMVMSGEVLALTLRSAELGYPGSFAYGWRGVWPADDNGDQYRFGQSYHRNNHYYFTWTLANNDQVFRTYVTPIPEPASILMLLFAACGLTLIARRY